MRNRFTRNTVRDLWRTFDKTAGEVAFYCPLLSAVIAADRPRGLIYVMEAALESGVSERSLEEAVLQSHLFVGFPAMIEAARLLTRIAGKKADGSGLPKPYSGDACAHWHSQGLEKIKWIYGPRFDQLVPYVNSFSPDILVWMINDGYGKVLSRPGLSFRVRELCVVATLTVTSYEHQLRAHIRGALSVGVGKELVRRTIDNCRYFVSRAKLEKTHSILKRAASEVYA